MKLEELKSNYTIAIDADGVICDFSKRVKEITGETPENARNKGKIWVSISDYDKNVQPFFETLEKMPDADTLMNFVKSNFYNYFILTACGFTPRDAADQKKRWFAKNYGKDLIVKVVTKSPDKAQYANEHTILIDDRSKSIDPWVAAGGIGILHTDANSTIEQLKKYL